MAPPPSIATLTWAPLAPTQGQPRAVMCCELALQEGNMPQFREFAHFRGVNTPIMNEFKLPMV